MRKTTFLYPVAALISILLALPCAQLHATVYNDNGSANTYVLVTGDTLKINSGTFTGTIRNLPAGAVVYVSNGASFKPALFSSPSGTVINYGTVSLSIAIFSPGINFIVENYGIVTHNGNLISGA